MPRHAGTGDDVGIVHPIPVAVERAVVQHDGTIAGIRVGAAGDVEQEPQVARVTLQIVADESVAAGELHEHPRYPGPADAVVAEHGVEHGQYRLRDRKSTRLNSSHLVISYAVF